jgi:hypothetical protein
MPKRKIDPPLLQPNYLSNQPNLNQVSQQNPNPQFKVLAIKDEINSSTATNNTNNSNNESSLASSEDLNDQHVKLDILPSNLVNSSVEPKNNKLFNQKNKQNDLPKVIMLPDSLQTGTKRRRVVRACDRCRKLKIKCSGDLPCIHCTVYSYECTYDQPNRCKKKPEPARPGNIHNINENSNTNINMNINNLQRSSSSNIKPANVNNNKTNNFSKGNFGSLSRSAQINSNTKNNNSNSIDRFNSSTVSVLASSNPELFSKLTDRLKLYDDILHRLLPEIKLTDLNDNPKPINPMKLMSALNKLRDMGKSISKSSSKQIAKMYDSLPEMPLPHLPITKLPPNSYNSTNITNINTSNITQAIPLRQSILNKHQLQTPSTSQTPDLNSPYQGIDGSLESSMGKEIKIILPSREIALDLITKTWENACVLFRFYHRVAFIEDLNELYDTDPNQYTNKQQRFLPLVYSVMACGALFYKSDENTNHSKRDLNDDDDDDNDNNISNNSSTINTPNISNKDYIQRKDFEDEGYKYFIAARKLIDITDTRDTYGIQTIVMLIIFLQCSARLSTCYAYIGIALRAALREGLHRKLDYPFNPIELEIRKRLFWTIYKMDIYVNTMLGLPRTISSDDFDQDLPIELDDENITVNGYRFDRQGDRLSSSGIANAHTRLIFLMKEVVTKLYPIKPKKLSTINSNAHNRTQSDQSNDNNLHINSNLDTDGNDENSERNRNDLMRNNFVYDLELKLQDWMNSLPLELKPGVEPPGQYLKANRLLHMSYLHVKIILYRPFIHYISANVKSVSSTDLACIEKAKNCINVARIVVKLSEDMINKNMLSGSYWFSIYTIFFSVACLVYYVHFAPSINRNGQPDSEYIAIKKDAENGKRVLDILKDSSMAARRTYNILNALFEQLNRKTARAGVGKTQFVPAHMGSSDYTTKQQQSQSKQQQPPPPEQLSPSKVQQPQQQKTAFQPVPNPGFSQSSQYANINNISSTFQTDDYSNYSSNNDNISTQISPVDNKIENQAGLSNDSQSIKIEQNLSKSISNVCTPFDRQPSLTDFASTFVNDNVNNDTKDNHNNTNNDNNTNSKNGKKVGPEGFNDITEYKYVRGPMDQMDMKIFGRFLPPYMLNNKNINIENENDPNKEIETDSINKTNSNIILPPTAKIEAIKHERQSSVFEPSLGLFTFVKDQTNENEDEFISKNNDKGNQNKGKFMNKNLAFNQKNEIVDPLSERNDDTISNWIDDDLLVSTNDYFNQVTAANAIPSGLSTVFQSENDKNNLVFSDETTSGVTSGGESKDLIDDEHSNVENNATIEVPSRFTSIEGIGMLDELIFGSEWDNPNNDSNATLTTDVNDNTKSNKE